MKTKLLHLLVLLTINAMDEYGRLTPGIKKFPSATDGKGFRPLADYVHSKGLKFGIHIMRGIPRQAVDKNLPVLGTNVKAQDIAIKSSTCPWNPDMYGVDATMPEGQAYYNSIVQMYADWGVDFIKCDDISRPYDKVQKAEIEALRKAIDKTGRPIVLSLSPGATPVKAGEHVMSLWAIGRSPLIFGGDMTKLDDMTKELLTNSEMLKVNQESTNNRQVYNEKNLIVWTADVPGSSDKYVALFNAQSKGDNIDFSNAAYASPIIAGIGNSQDISVSVEGGKKLVLFVNDGGNGIDWDHVAWIDPIIEGPKGKLKLTDMKWLSATSGWGNPNVDKTCDGQPLMVENQLVSGIGAHAKSVIIYELPEGYETFTAKAVVSVNFESIGIKGKANVRDLWRHKELGTFNGSFSCELPLHSAGLFKITQ